MLIDPAGWDDSYERERVTAKRTTCRNVTKKPNFLLFAFVGAISENMIMINTLLIYANILKVKKEKNCVYYRTFLVIQTIVSNYYKILIVHNRLRNFLLVYYCFCIKKKATGNYVTQLYNIYFQNKFHLPCNRYEPQ